MAESSFKFGPVVAAGLGEPVSEGVPEVVGAQDAEMAFPVGGLGVVEVDRGDSLPVEHRREFHQTDRPPARAQIRIGTASIPLISTNGEQLAHAAIDQLPVTISSCGQSIGIPIYRAMFRLLTVVFEVIGYVADREILDFDPLRGRNRILLPIWPAEHQKIWWPPVDSLDTVGGIPDRPLDQLQGVPMLIPRDSVG